MQLLCYPWIEIAFSPEQRDERLNGGLKKRIADTTTWTRIVGIAERSFEFQATRVL